MNSFYCFLIIVTVKMYSYNGHMTIISSTNLRNNLADALKMAQKKDYVLVSHRGKINTAIVDIDMLEDLLELNDKEYLASIKRAREQYKRGEYYTFEEVFGNI